MTSEEKTLLLGALFHDIGKFEQRGKPVNEREKHQLLSSAFVNKIFNDEQLANVVLNHHSEDLKKSDLKGKQRIVAEIICESDNLSSGERKPDLSVKEQQPFESIFSKVDFDNESLQASYQKISDISHNRYEFITEKISDYDLQKEYADWWNKFIKEFDMVNKEELETIIYLLKKYLWCVPSSSWRTRSDVSLYEHLRITAAISFCLYKFLKAKYPAIEDFKEIIKRDENRYLLILADITGIQKYIYNVGHKGASKALKGRSFYLQQTLDNIAYYLLDRKLNLPITNLIYSSGGKFYILAPLTDEVNQKIKEAQKELDEQLLKEYEGKLGIVFGAVELNGNDFSYSKEKGHLISEKWDKLNFVTEQSKKHKFHSVWNNDLFKPIGPDGELIKCLYTDKALIRKNDFKNVPDKGVIEIGVNKFYKHSYPNNVFYQLTDDEGNPREEEFISQEQYYSQLVGHNLKGSKNSLVVRDYLQGIPVLNINSFELTDKNEIDTNNGHIIRQLILDETDFLVKLKGKQQKGFKFYGGNWHLAEFEEVLTRGEGIQRLGVLRLDVDNLGLIFKRGLGNKATFSRVVQLSFMLDFFFSCYLNKLEDLKWSIKEGVNENSGKKLKELIQIVYSGGDDVFIVGHWSALPAVALWINKEFKRYTLNDNFTISAGIYLFDNKFPLFKAAQESGSFEDRAKKKERENRDNSKKKKDGICFLDIETPLSWKDFEIISTRVKIIYDWIQNGKDGKKISKGFISRMYSIYNEYLEGKYNNWARWRWRAAYSLSRFGRQYEKFKDEINEFAAQLFSSSQTEQELIKLLYILVQWTDLLTRKKGE